MLQVADASGSLIVTMYDDQAKDVLGMTADEMAVIKEGNGNAYHEALRKACLGDVYYARVQVRPDTYKDEVRRRFNVAGLYRMDFAKESRNLIDRIHGMQQGTADA